MRANTFGVTELKELTELLKHLAYFHDASLTKVTFIKRRYIGEDGDLVYPFESYKIPWCHIKMRLLHNNYEGAKLKQVVDLYFKDVQSFGFAQNEKLDYSEIYDTQCLSKGDKLKFTFYCSAKAPILKRIWAFLKGDMNAFILSAGRPVLKFTCARFICRER